MKNGLQGHGWSSFESTLRLVGLLSMFVVLVIISVGGCVRTEAQSDGHATQTGTVLAEDTSPSDAVPTMYTCSMHPQIRQPRPGKCPICAMDLIPVQKTAGGLRTLTVTPEARALMGVETVPVERRYVEHEIRMVGKIDYDESRLGYITAWVSGRLDRLYVDYTGVPVRKGDHMVLIYSEQLYSAQQELIQALRFARQRQGTVAGNFDLVEAAREKLRLLGLTDEQIAEIEKRDRPSAHVTIYAPVSGIVIEKLRQEGERVQVGDRIYTIADLSLVWVYLDAYESDLPWLRYGQDVTITTEAYPGEQFHGRISLIYPMLNEKTRTVKVRVNVPNEDGRLKPGMFVHAVVRPRIAAGGRVLDPSLAGKWICFMHPEIVKDGPGRCDRCEMELVRAESLGYVTPETDQQDPPLVIPYSAVLPTGTRAVVYVELPEMPSFIEPAFAALSDAVSKKDLGKIRQAFADFGRVLDRPYDRPGTAYAHKLWQQLAGQLAEHALAGQRAATIEEAERAFGQVERTMDLLRECFAPVGQPTFEGREIVLGPRAGQWQLVRNGLQEGEMVVVKGNFKIDAEIQIQAKPSMMNPAGSAVSVGHAGHGAAMPQHEKQLQPTATLPSEFLAQVRELFRRFDELTAAVEAGDLEQIRRGFAEFGQSLQQVDGTLLSGKARAVWKELAMLLSNDVVEGQEAKQLQEMDRVYLLLKGHLLRLRSELGVQEDTVAQVEKVAVPDSFQKQLVPIWQQYLAVQDALASDDLSSAAKAAALLESSVVAIDDSGLESLAKKIWHREQQALAGAVKKLRSSQNIAEMREAFDKVSQQIGVIVRAFGFGAGISVYELHCPMAFGGRGAIWYQADKDVRNPYYGASMLKCADRVELIAQ